MSNLFKYNFRIFVRNRDQLFWNTLFPLAYLLIYVMAMHNLSAGFIKMPLLKIAILPAETESSLFVKAPPEISLRTFFQNMEGEALEAELSDRGLEAAEGEMTDDVFILYRVAPSAEMAEQWLKDGWVYAVVEERPQESPAVKVMGDSSEIKPLLLEQILKIYTQVNRQIGIYSDAVKEGRISISEAISDGLHAADFQKFRELDPTSRSKTVSMVNVFYFSLVAYLSFYPINTGSFVVISTEANRSPASLRQSASPRSKRQRFIGNFFPYLLIVLANTALFYLILQLIGVDLGGNHALVLLLMGTTSLSAMLTGSCLAAFFGFSEGALIAMSISLPLIFASMSGMMSNAFYNLLMHKAAWINDLNPIGICSRALYYLSGDRLFSYWQQLIKLALFCLITFALTLIGLRRNSYESL